MLQACDIGHRVVVRRRVGDRATDILGILETLDERQLIIRTEDGSEHAVALDEVVAGKRVPPRPPKYSEMITLERVADRAWPAPVHERLGDWYLRAAEGWTNRANSALPVGDAGVDLDEALTVVAGWYRERGLEPKVTVPLPVRRDVADALRQGGWEPQPLVLVQTVPLTQAANEAAQATRDDAVALTTAPTDGFLAIVQARKESLPAAAARVMNDVPAVRFAEARDTDGTLLAITRGAVVDGWLHISLVEVVPAARRKGLAQALFRTLAAWARDEHHATRAVLQVEERNAAAVALYAGLGFTTHHSYVTYHPGVVSP